MSLLIRAANGHDYSAICELFAEADAFHAHALPDRFRPSLSARSETFFREVLASTEHHLLLAEVAQQPVGLIEFRVIQVTEQPPVAARSFLSIESLIVNKAYRKRGVGHELMQAVEQWAVAQLITTIELNVFAFNRGAIQFYEKRGYAVLSQRMIKKLEQ